MFPVGPRLLPAALPAGLTAGASARARNEYYCHKLAIKRDRKSLSVVYHAPVPASRRLYAFEGSSGVTSSPATTSGRASSGS